MTNGLLVSSKVAGFSLWPRTVSVINPAVVVERKATRLMPHSKSKKVWLIELVLPLL